ncbi:MAG: hypothetical protein K2X81_27415, partial [Candidatus Obscuribacterales bacterium]|nr:hypothetical protein [Candidatus Obscuribacterales bacterium]
SKGESHSEISAISIVASDPAGSELAHSAVLASEIAVTPEESCNAGTQESDVVATSDASSCQSTTETNTCNDESQESSCADSNATEASHCDPIAAAPCSEDPASSSADSESAVQADETHSKKNKHKGQGKKSDAPKTQHPTPELVVRPAPDGKVFTRFRPREFSDDTRMYRTYRGGPPIVGACVIVDGKLTETIGVLPQPAEGGDQLRLLLSISKEAVGKPGRAFIESNEVLNELFQMSKSRAIHKDAYVLLFQRVEDEVDQNVSDDDDLDDSSSDENVSVDHAQNSADADLNETSDEEQPESALDEEATESEESSSATESTESDMESTDAGADSNPVSADEQSALTVHSDSDSVELDDSDSDEEDDDDAAVKCELVSKRTDDGRIITRFRTFDFSDARNLYENFKTRPQIVGAAVIKERDLLKVMGTVPQVEGRRQLDVLLDCSRQALEKPALDFISADVVLNGLYELANGEYRQKEYEVVLFTETDGRLTIFSTMDKRGKALSKGPL